MLAYVADEMREKEELAGSLTAVDADQYHDTDRITEVLHTGATPYALLYFACHGIAGESVEVVAIGSLAREKQLLVLGHLEYALRKVRLRGAVFINACHSARMFEDRDMKIVQGFPALFLRLGAPGVIGTVGEVSSSFAAEFAAEFAAGLLSQTQASPDVSLPELLRRRRAAIVQECVHSEVTDMKRLVAAFMYVYYGNPSCTVSIQRAT